MMKIINLHHRLRVMIMTMITTVMYLNLVVSTSVVGMRININDNIRSIVNIGTNSKLWKLWKNNQDELINKLTRCEKSLN